MSRDSKEFEVELVVTVHYLTTVTARSPEEAESIAEGMLEDGDILEIVSSVVDYVEAIPIEDIVEEVDPEFEEEELDDTSDD